MNKRVLIIGASSAIGCEVIRQIADEQTTILAHYYSHDDKLEALRNEVKGDIRTVAANLSSEDDVTKIIASAKELYGYPDQIIFLAAPHFSLTRFKDLKAEEFHQQMDMQLYSAVTILQQFLPQMAAAKYGKVIFMLTSYTIGIPPASMAHYVTAKYAMLGLMKALSAEYASKQLCINAISPSMIETHFLSSIPEKIVEFTAQQHPRKRNGTPKDVAPVIKFLLSDEAGYITGVNMPITGGA